MPGKQLPQPKQLFQDNAWNPLVGGQIFTYAAGTLTLKATFQDDALTIANTNPVIVNARGEVSMHGTGSYRVILKDAVGNTIYDVDNLESGLSLFAPLTSPALTGNPTAPTPPQFDNDTSIATTAFVRMSSQQANQQLFNAGATLTAADCGKSVIGASGAPFTIILPLAAAVADGSRIAFSNMNAGIMTVQRQGIDNINNGAANTNIVLGVGGRMVLESYSVTSQWYVVGGSGLGVDQLWRNLSGSRAVSTTYTNAGKPIVVSASIISSAIGSMTMNWNISGVAQPSLTHYSAGAGYVTKDTMLVPANATYSLIIGGSAGTSLQNWFELS